LPELTKRGDRIKLTKRFVDRLRGHPSDKDTCFWDAEIGRFGLRQTGRALAYVIQYRNRGGRSRRVTIANANTVTPDEARRRALALLTRIDDPHERHDPVAEKRAERDAETFAEIAGAYQGSPAWLAKAQSTRDVESGLVARHLLPLLGTCRVKDIKRADVEQAFADIRDGKTAIDRPSGKPRGRIRVRGGVGTARRTLQLAGAIFSFAVDRGLIPSNPCARLKLGASGTRDTIIEDETGYAALFRSLAELEREHAISGPAANALRVIALTGARRGEILNLRGRHLDLQRQRIVLPPHEHKAGRRTGKPRVIALPTSAVAILAGLIEGGVAPDVLVFKSAKPGSPIALKGPWAKVRARASLPASLTMHGLRHSIGSHLAMGGASGPEIKTALGHANIATSVRYIHFAEGRKNALAERAAAVALAGLHASEEAGDPGADVVPLRPAAG
jgi:integrase